MNTAELNERIEALPEELKEQVSEYIDFLLYRHQEKQLDLTHEGKSELDTRWDHYLRQSSSASSDEEVKKRLEKKYGVSD